MNKQEFDKVFVYDQESPSGLSWKETKKAGKYNAFTVHVKGEYAGYKKKSTNYYYVKFNGRALATHRVVYCMHNPDFDYSNDMVIDHMDGNLDNNRISNLRAVDQATNNRNRRVSILSKTGISGLTYTISAKGYAAWRAVIATPEGRKSKYFSVLKYGEDESEILALLWLEAEHKKLKERGVGFTYRPQKQAQTAYESEEGQKYKKLIFQKIDEALQSKADVVSK